MMETKVLIHGHIEQPTGWSILFHQVFSECLRRGMDVLLAPLSKPQPNTISFQAGPRFSPIFQERLCTGTAPREFHEIIIAPPTHIGTRPHTYITCLAGEEVGKAKSILSKASRVLCPHDRMVPFQSEPFRITLDGLLDMKAPTHARYKDGPILGCGHSERMIGFLNRLEEILRGEQCLVRMRPTSNPSNPGHPIDKRVQMPPPCCLDWPEKAEWYGGIAAYLTDRKGLGFSALEAALCGATPFLLEGEWDDVVAKMRACYLQPDCLPGLRELYLEGQQNPAVPTILEALFR